jgi:general secretion pathway protein C
MAPRPDSRTRGYPAPILALTLGLCGCGAGDAPDPAAVAELGEGRAPAASAPAAAPEATPAPAPSLDGLRLHGLLGGGAIIAFPDGRQRFVRLGSNVLPGLRLDRIEPDGAYLRADAGESVLRFAGMDETIRSDAPAAGTMTSATAGPPMPPRSEETLRYRLGLEPRRADGRIRGYAVRPGAAMPALQRAGLRAGDVLLMVNGQTFDSDEKVMELAGEIAGSYTAEFEFERAGKRMRASLEVNPRPSSRR